LNGTYATTGSNTFAGIQTVNSNLVVTGSITAQTLVVQTVTSSVVYSSGSNVFGNDIANTQTFTGSVLVTGSITATEGNFLGSGVDGSLGSVVRISTTNTNGNARNWALVNTFDSYGDLNFRISTAQGGNALVSGSTILTLSRTGAATFSSTLTTSGKITVNGGGLLLDLNGGSDTFLRVTGNRGNGDNLHIANIEFYNSFSSRLVGEMRGITGAGGTQSNSGQLVFYTNDNGTYAERMRISSGGLVYMGTNLQTYGRLNIGSTGTQLYNGITIYSTDGTESFLGLGCSGTTAGINVTYGSTGSYLPFVVLTGGAERMRINSDGPVDVGGWGTGGNISLRIKGNSNQQVGFFNHDGQLYMPFLDTSTGTDLVLTSGGYINKKSSSIRYKENIEPIDIGLDFIMSLNAVKFNMKSDGLAQVGFVAEEFPDERLVTFSQVDIKDASKGLQKESINYAQITAPLVKAIQELQAQITELKNK
jgi:hypothetical protein